MDHACMYGQGGTHRDQMITTRAGQTWSMLRMHRLIQNLPRVGSRKQTFRYTSAPVMRMSPARHRLVLRHTIGALSTSFTMQTNRMSAIFQLPPSTASRTVLPSSTTGPQDHCMRLHHGHLTAKTGCACHILTSISIPPWLSCACPSSRPRPAA